MSAVSNIYRTASAIRNHMERTLLTDYDSAIRNHMERTLLTDYDLSWVAFTVLWVLWIWDEQETGHVAAEAGVTKGTLTGVMKTLQTRKLIRRIPHRDDRRRVSIGLTKAGERLIEEVFPEFNQQETLAVSALSEDEQFELARLLRLVLQRISIADSEETS